MRLWLATWLYDMRPAAVLLLYAAIGAAFGLAAYACGMRPVYAHATFVLVAVALFLARVLCDLRAWDAERNGRRDERAKHKGWR